MRRVFFPRVTSVSALFMSLALGACQSAPHPAPGIVLAPGAGVVGAGSAAAIAAADAAARAFAPADVEFMQGMIPHHAQAVVMARWAVTHGARADVKILCERIVIAQTDEIRMMRRWLGERSQEVPDSMSMRHVMRMGGVAHEMLMPGMLTDEQLAALDKARSTWCGSCSATATPGTTTRCFASRRTSTPISRRRFTRCS